MKHNSSCVVVIRSAFSLIELLIVLAILGLLVLLAMPAVQMVRESARQMVCKNNLRNWAIAIQNFESSYGKLPPGTMSCEPFQTNTSWDAANEFYTNPTAGKHWTKSQHLSWAAYAAPFAEQGSALERIQQSSFSVVTHTACPLTLESAIGVCQTHLPILYCPSDNLQEEANAGLIEPRIFAQPGVSNDMLLGESDYFLQQWEEIWPVPIALKSSFGGSNYSGCCGVFSSVCDPRQRNPGYAGALLCGHASGFNSVSDGASNTILIGESIGEISEGVRSQANCWLFGSVARGRGYTSWMSRIGPNGYFLSDWKQSSVVAFGSKHPTVVNIANVDASVHAIYRGISVDVWYAMCGRGEGKSTLDSAEK